MADAASSSLPRRVARGIAATWRALGIEQRVAGIGAVLLIVSTFGPFSFVEGAIVLTGASVLLLLRRRAQGREFHLPFGDGAMIAAAGAWSAVLILLRLFSRPLGQGLLALVCAAILVVAGLRERATRMPDDLPTAPERRQRGTRPRRRERPRRERSAAAEDLFGSAPPQWTTPPSGDPAADTPPAWPREQPPRRSVPPATRIARAGERPEPPADEAEE
jgi:hypothetical protein